MSEHLLDLRDMNRYPSMPPEIARLCALGMMIDQLEGQASTSERLEWVCRIRSSNGGVALHQVTDATPYNGDSSPTAAEALAAFFDLDLERFRDAM